MSVPPAPNPFNPKVQTPVPQNAAHDGYRASPDAGRGAPNRDTRPFPSSADLVDYDDGAWM